jgi:hypothetical protein
MGHVRGEREVMKVSFEERGDIGDFWEVVESDRGWWVEDW